MNVMGQTRTMVGAETQRKTTKLAKFSDVASAIEGAPHVLVSGIVPAESIQILQAHAITDIINCAPDVVTNPSSGTSHGGTTTSATSATSTTTATTNNTMTVHQWSLSDDKSERIDPFFFRALDIIEATRINNGHVLVHCYQGVSRSVSLVVAYLIWSKQTTYHDALDLVRRTRGIARPNIGFQCQLTLWRSLYMEPTKGPLTTARMYHAIQHTNDKVGYILSLCVDTKSAYAPAVPSCGMLRSNGVYVLHVPVPVPKESTKTQDDALLFIWCGANITANKKKQMLVHIVHDIELLLKYSLRFQHETHRLVCVQQSDTDLCSVAEHANEQEENMFWVAMGAASTMDGKARVNANSLRQEEQGGGGSDEKGAVKMPVVLQSVKSNDVRRGEGVAANAMAPAVVTAAVVAGAATATSNVNYPALYLKTGASAYEHLSTYDDEDLDPEQIIVLRASETRCYICVGNDCVDDEDVSNETEAVAVHAFMWKEYMNGHFGTVVDGKNVDSSAGKMKLIVVCDNNLNDENWNAFMDSFAEGL